MDQPLLVAQFAGWYVRGIEGGVNALESLTMNKIQIPENRLPELEKVAHKIGAIINEQRRLYPPSS